MKQYTRLALCTYTIDLESGKGRSSLCFFSLSIFVLFCWKTCICKNEFHRKKLHNQMPTRIYSDNYYYSFSCCIFFLYLNLSFVAIFFYLLPDFFLASFSILSPRIIFTSVINKSELWTFFTDCAAAWWCQSYCLLDASTEMSWRCALFSVVALCNGFCCCYVSFTGNMGKLMRMKFIRKSYVILLYLNTYKDDCLDFAAITLLWHWLLHYTHFILCVCVCVSDDAHKSAL